MALISQSPLRTKAEIIYTLFDFDHSQLISKDELVVLVKTVITAINAMTGRPEATIQLAQNKTKDLFSKYDINKDANISLSEFQSICSKDNEILRVLLAHGLINNDDLRIDFGNGFEGIPEPDSDLEDELDRINNDQLTIEGQIPHFSKDKKDQDSLPWIPIAQATLPNDIVYPPELPPDSSLKLEHVYGYRSSDCRNNIKYSFAGDLVYPVGSVCVIMDPKKNTQEFFTGHTGEILCLDINEISVATGQGGPNPGIIIWDLKSQNIQTVIQGIWNKGLAYVAFSTDGTRIAGIDFDDQQVLCIYEVNKCIGARGLISKRGVLDGLVSSTITFRERVLDMKWEPSNRAIILACNQKLCFVNIEGTYLKLVNCEWDRVTPMALLSIGSIENSTVTGSFKGDLLVWRNYKFMNSYKAHNGPIYCIVNRKQGRGLITGSNDGFVKVWDSAFKLEITHNINQIKLNIFDFKIKSLCESQNEVIAVGTKSSDIIEIHSAEKIKVVMRGHYFGDLTGLAMHPFQGVFYTVGEDHMLGVWEISGKKQLNLEKIEYPAKCISISNDGKLLAIGCKNGHVLIRDSKSMSLVCDLKDRQSEVNCIRFSTNNEKLAVAYGHPDCEIFLYSAKGTFKPEVKFRGSLATTTHMDFSVDGKVIQLNNAGEELIFFDTTSGKRITTPSDIRDTKWQSYSCIYGFPALSIHKNWSQIMDNKSEFQAICADRSNDQTTFAVGDSKGYINLYRYPAFTKNFSPILYGGHCGEVSNIKFSSRLDYLVSLDKSLKVIFQWKYIPPTDINSEEQMLVIKTEEISEDNKIEEISKHLITKSDIDNNTPTTFKNTKELKDVPNANLQLIHMFSPKVTALYSSTDKVIFASGTMCSITDRARSQTFFQLHLHTITAMAVHPKGNIIASATDGPGEVKIWDVESKSIQIDLPQKGFAVTHLSFSVGDGSKLITVWKSPDNLMGIWDWQSKMLLNISPICNSNVKAISWRSDFCFATVGDKHVKVWTLSGKNLDVKRNVAVPWQPMTSAVWAFGGSTLVVGGSKGTLLWWGETSNKQDKAHNVAITVLSAHKITLYSGDENGLVNAWNLSGGIIMRIAQIVDLSSLTTFNLKVQSIHIKIDSTLLIFNGHEIFEGKQGTKFSTIISGHRDEVNDVAFSPISYFFATAGKDKTIKLWDIESKVCEKTSEKFDHEITALDWTLIGKIIAGGDKKCNVFLFDQSTLKVLHSLPAGFKKITGSKNEPSISVVKISQSGQMLAVGATNCQSEVEIFTITGGKLQSKGTLKPAFTTGISHIDWSSDVSHLAACSNAFELRFYSLKTMKQVSFAIARDIDFFTWSIPVGFPTHGLNDITTICRTHCKRLIIGANENNQLFISRNPAIEDCQIKLYRGHGEKIKRIATSFDDLYAVSVGKVVHLWKTDFAAKDQRGKAEEIKASDDEIIHEIEEEYLQVPVKKIGKIKFHKMFTDDENYYEDDMQPVLKEIIEKQNDDTFASKPWLSVIKEPIGYLKPDLKSECKPKVQQDIHHVFGYRSKKCRNNVRFLKNGQIVYHVGALGIVYEQYEITTAKGSQEIIKQRYFLEHLNEISAMDVHIDGLHIATGDQGPDSLICVWNSTNLRSICTFENPIQNCGVSALSFNKSGDKLAAAMIDCDHSVAVWDIKVSGGSLLAIAKGGRNYIFSICFKTDNEFITCGTRHLKFWTLNQNNLTCVNAIYEREINNIFLTMVVFMEDCIVGDFAGVLQIWKNETFASSNKLHDGPIDALFMHIN